MSEYISPYSPQLTGRSGHDRILYRDYLQSKNLVTDVTSSVEKVSYSISESSREMIGTIEQLHERGYEMVTSAVAHLGSDLRDGFEGVSWQLDDISDEITALSAKFDWGFSQMIAGIGRVNDSLKELIAVAKTPAETWAYNQYEIARDAIRRELYPEAIEALERAITGYGDHVGYKLEYRFHYTLGILYLGDVTNSDPAVLDLDKAEASFLVAARYAKADFPMEASVALTAAGWAAYCQSKPEAAEGHSKQAIALHPENSEAIYQLAKIQMHTNRPKEAIPNLRRAAKLAPHYTIKAATDPDFLRFENDLRDLIDLLRQDAERQATPALVEAKGVLDTLDEWETERVFDSEMKLLKDAFSKAERNSATNTFLGFLDAKSDADRVTSFGKRLIKELQQLLERRVGEWVDCLSGFRTAFQSRGAHSPSFKKANETLNQVGKGVQTLDDHEHKMDMLNRARKHFQNCIQEFRTQMQRRRVSTEVQSLLFGVLVGAAAGLIPSLVASVFLMVPIICIFAGTDRVSDSILFGGMIPGLIVSAVIGVWSMRKKFLDSDERDIRQMGTEPSLPQLDLSFSAWLKTECPGPVFDASSFGPGSDKREASNERR